MRGDPTTFWGKYVKGNEGTASEWHPLVDHCADVAAVVEALVHLPVWRDRLSRLAGSEINEVSGARLCVLAALHDIGKFNLGFQAICREDIEVPRTGHQREALGVIFRPELSCLHQALSNWGDGATRLLKTALCHHGQPYTEETWQQSWWGPCRGLDPVEGIADLIRRSRQWFPRAFEPDATDLPDNSEFSHAYAGLVMLADWIGSDTNIFPFSREGEGDRMDRARSKATQAVIRMGVDVKASDRKDPDGRCPFARIAPSGYTPRPAQTAILNLPVTEGGTITILEAETGSGKTEAALTRFIQLFEAGAVDGLYFALPTRAAATQMHQRVTNAMKRAFPSSMTPPPAVILAVPGYLRVDDSEGTRLPHFRVQWPDEGRDRYRAWAAEQTKRYLVGCVVVGTIDQVLLSSLMVKHAHLRATALLRHLLVVDEVHASDAYMTRILEDVLARHKAAGGHALLLSATLGSEARARLLNPRGGVSSPRIEIDAAKKTPFPQLTFSDSAGKGEPIGGAATPRSVAMMTERWMDDTKQIATAALKAAMQGAKVFVIRNTVRDCVATQEAVEEEAAARNANSGEVLFGCVGRCAPHHSRFATVDRRALDTALEFRYGKKRPDGGCLVVATQTIEQSLDLDADILFTDLCPADVLLQRIGRVHRHARRGRPRFYETPRVVVLVPLSRDLGELLQDDGQTRRGSHGLGRVYPDLRVLEATWRLLAQHPTWDTPAMNRALIEGSVHSFELARITQEKGPPWDAHATTMDGTAYGHMRLAELSLVDRTRPYDEMTFPDLAENGPIMTRLGEGDRRVRFDPGVVGPFGYRVTELVLPAWLVSGIPADVDVAEHVDTGDGVTRFNFGEKQFRYDRLGLRSV